MPGAGFIVENPVFIICVDRGCVCIFVMCVKIDNIGRDIWIGVPDFVAVFDNNTGHGGKDAAHCRVDITAKGIGKIG